MIFYPEPVRIEIVIAQDEEELGKFISLMPGWKPFGSVYTRQTINGRCVAQVVMKALPKE